MLKDRGMRGQISRLFGSALMVAAIMPLSVSVAIAQAGSTGGAIGKQGKSASGGEEAPALPRSGPAPKSNEAKESPCRKLPGAWSWFVGGDVSIKPGGTFSQGSLTGTWTCKNDQVVMFWSHGFTDRLTMSPDGVHLKGTNGYVSVTGDRK